MSQIIEINENYPNAIQPDYINIKLKEHQLKLLNKCYEIELNNIIMNNITIDSKMGVICDSVGSGKSYVILSLVKHEATIRNINYTNVNLLVNSYTTDIQPISKNLSILVVPHGIFTQWKDYINNTKLSVYYIQTNKHLKDIKYDVDLIMVSSSRYNDFAKLVSEFKFNKIFYDEVDSLNISGCIQINCNFYWFVTASYSNLLYPKTLSFDDYCNFQKIPMDHRPDSNIRYYITNGFGNRMNHPNYNNYYKILKMYTEYKKNHTGLHKTGFIRNIFNDLYSYEYRYLLFLKNSSELIAKSFTLPQPIINMIICKQNQDTFILDGIISDDIQQMLFAGDIDNAIKSFDIEHVNENNIIKVVASNLEEELSNIIIDLNAAENKTYKSNATRENSINSILRKKEDIEQKIQNIKDRILTTEMDPITYDEITNPTIIKCCNQVFDFESITIYLTSKSDPKCPICRSDITKESLVLIKNIKEEDIEEEEKKKEIEHIYENYNKLDNLKYLLQYKIPQESKILIFSNFATTFDQIINIFDSVNKPCHNIKGQSNTIGNLINKYKDNDSDVHSLFINAKYFGAGLNLENTTDLIIFHKMDKALENQVIGRAQRVGRVEPLRIWYLYASNE